MGRIYKITNLINNKKYIGKTIETLEKRWKRHVYSALREENPYPLSRAIRKYGEEAFKIELIEEAPDSELSELEIKYIKIYNTFEGDGYNATIGGDGLRTVPSNLILEYYNKGYTIEDIHLFTGYNSNTISRILKENNQRILNAGEVVARRNKVLFSAYNDKGEKVKTFLSYAEAAHWLIEMSYISNQNIRTITSNLRKVVDDETKFLYKHRWKNGDATTISPGKTQNNTDKKIQYTTDNEIIVFNNTNEAINYIIEKQLSSTSKAKSIKETLRIGLKEKKIKYGGMWNYIN